MPDQQKHAPLTLLLLLALVAVYCAQLTNPALTDTYALVPAHRDPVELITSTFLHSPRSSMHLLANLVALYVFGTVVERAVGTLLFALIYVASALGGSLAVMLLSDPYGATVGASGAIYGLFGAAIIIRITARQWPLYELGALVLNLVMSFTVVNISWQAHIGGLVLGLVVSGVAVAVLATSSRGRSGGAAKKARTKRASSPTSP